MSVDPTLPLVVTGAAAVSAVEPPVEVRRSTRRKRTVTAFRDAGRIVVVIPARMSKADERTWVATMLERLAAREAKRRPSSADLAERAQQLSERYLGGRARPTSIRWVGTMRSRWGSCTPTDGSIRISDRVQRMPGYVIDYVVLHELAHLLVAGHGPAFWVLLADYPRLERARGYLDGAAAAAGLDLADPEDSA